MLHAVLAIPKALLPGATDENQRHYLGQQFAIAFTMYIALASQLALDVIAEGAFARRVIALWTYSGMRTNKETFSALLTK